MLLTGLTADFASFRRSGERRANFAAAFGQSLEEFAADALAA